MVMDKGAWRSYDAAESVRGDFFVIEIEDCEEFIFDFLVEEGTQNFEKTVAKPPPFLVLFRAPKQAKYRESRLA